MSSFYGNASIGSGLPEVNNNDNGKVLIAKDGEWELGFPSADGLPAVTENDNGKALVINNGQWDIDKIDVGYSVTDGKFTTLIDEDINANKVNVPSGNTVYSTNLIEDFSSSDAPKTIRVTIDNGESYIITRQDFNDLPIYGEGGPEGPDFTNYPFCILDNTIYTESQNYHLTIESLDKAVEVSDDFTAAVQVATEANGLNILQNLKDGPTTGSIYGINTYPTWEEYVIGVVGKNPSTGTIVTHTIGQNAFSEGTETKAGGESSHAEGGGTTASGDCAHAEGADTIASGLMSHAEGHSTVAQGESAHAEGTETFASGESSHAEGLNTQALGSESHAEGWHTIANHAAQHVFGSYNIADGSNATSTNKGNYIEIVGNGSGENMKSNARTLDWDGNEVLAGRLTIGDNPINNMDVTTKQYVDTAVNNVSGGGLQNLVDGSAQGSVRGINTAEEDINYTIGQNAFAEGNLTKASGQNSHAEGADSVASGQNTHAEGGGTTASNWNSHAEGQGTTASNFGAHSEGVGTTASGRGSHAEGITDGTFTLFDVTYTPAAGSRGAHTEGYNTYANAGASDRSPHAEGADTAAIGAAAHAEGHYTLASGDHSHAEGNQTQATGTGAHAEGIFSVASGNASHAEGGGTASGPSSHAEGNNTIANHASQHVFGSYNIEDPSTAAVTQRGIYVEIVGNGTTGARSNARTLDWNGNEVLAGKLTVGADPTNNMDVATKQYVDTAVGSAGGSGGGLQNLVDGSATGSVRGQYTNTTIGEKAFAEGSNTKASGNYSHAEGTVTKALGMASHAEGNSGEAGGKFSHAEGSLTNASGVASHSEGNSTFAIGDQSHAEGTGTNARGSQSHAEGLYTIAKHKSQHVFGEYNIADGSNATSTQRGTYIEIVGNGTSTATNDRSNARTLDWDGNEVLAGNLTVNGGSLTLGDTTFTAQDFNSNLQNFVDGASSGSVRGVNTSTQIGQYALAEGYNTKAAGEAAHAEGNNTQALSNYSHAEGSMTYAAGEAAHAEGNNAQATGSAAHAEGANTIANHAYQHVFGQYNIEDNSETENTQRGNYVEIVGNGAAGIRSNARTLDWNGNEVLSGKLTVGVAPTNNMDVTTKQYVDTAIINASNAGLPPVTTADNGKTFVASNGEWTIDNVDLGYTVTKSTESFYNDSLIMNVDDNGIYSTYINDENDTDWSNVVGLRITPEGKDPIILNKTLENDGHINFGDFDENNFMPLFDNEEIVCQYYSDSSLKIYAQNDQQSIVIEKIVETVDATHDFHLAVNNAIDFIPIKNIVDGSKSFDNNYQSQGSLRGILAEEENDDEESESYYILGQAAVALGDGTRASGMDSMAIGNYTIAAGVNSFAEGSNTKADGMQSHVEGEDTYASGQNTHAEGRGGEFTIDNITYKSRADGKNTHAEGYQTIASCNVNWGAAHAEGVRTQALGEGSHAEGGQTIASQRAAHAEGAETTASGQVSHAEGSRTIASGTCSHAEGSSTIVSGINSHGEGELTTVSGNNAHAEGWQTTASGLASHAEGYNTTAAGKTSGNASAAHAEGYYTQATGDASHTEGRETMASGDGAHAEGGYTQASGVDAHTEGYKTVANHRSQHVFGEYNIADNSSQTANQRGNYVEIVGNGSSENSRSNIRTLDWDGNEVLAGTLTVGRDPTSNLQVATKQYVDNTINTNALNNLVDGSQAGSIRTTATAAEENGYTIGANAFAEGDNTQASGVAAHAEGSESVASGQGAHAEGQNTTASGSFAHAEGYSTTANHAYQHVFGQLNIPDPAITLGMDIGTYVEIVGNGTANNLRSNARTLDWKGNEILAGSLTVKGGSLTLGDTTFTENDLGGAGLPTVTASDNGKSLVVENGEWAVDNIDLGYDVTNNLDVLYDDDISGTQTNGRSTASINTPITADVIRVTIDDQDPIELTANRGDYHIRYADPNGNIVIDTNLDYGRADIWTVDPNYHLKIESVDRTIDTSENFEAAVNSVINLHNLVDGSTEGSIRGIDSSAEGSGYTIGRYACTVGNGTGATGEAAHAEGTGTQANGQSSHAEGYFTTATGPDSHAEGGYTQTTYQYAHAEGNGTKANGESSHAEGAYTTANGRSQHVFGEYNIVESIAEGHNRGQYVEIVGNGSTLDNLSNARTLDWDGNEVLAGGLTVGAAGITIGSTTITEAQLQALLAMLNS